MPSVNEAERRPIVRRFGGESLKEFVFPHEALAMVFRGKFLEQARKAVPGVDFSNLPLPPLP